VNFVTGLLLLSLWIQFKCKICWEQTIQSDIIASVRFNPANLNINLSPNMTHASEITRDQTRNMNTTMATMLRPLLRPITCIGSLVRPVRCHCRYFSPSTPPRTDGVYSELTAMRTRTPFIEAFRKEQERKSSADAPAPAHGPTPDKVLSLSLKSMSDSYHRVASHVTSL
jgi:hypothetical protein